MVFLAFAVKLRKVTDCLHYLPPPLPPCPCIQLGEWAVRMQLRGRWRLLIFRDHSRTVPDTAPNAIHLLHRCVDGLGIPFLTLPAGKEDN